LGMQPAILIAVLPGFMKNRKIKLILKYNVFEVIVHKILPYFFFSVFSPSFFSSVVFLDFLDTIKV